MQIATQVRLTGRIDVQRQVFGCPNRVPIRRVFCTDIQYNPRTASAQPLVLAH